MGMTGLSRSMWRPYGYLRVCRVRWERLSLNNCKLSEGLHDVDRWAVRQKRSPLDDSKHSKGLQKDNCRAVAKSDCRWTTANIAQQSATKPSSKRISITPAIYGKTLDSYCDILDVSKKSSSTSTQESMQNSTFMDHVYCRWLLYFHSWSFSSAEHSVTSLWGSVIIFEGSHAECETGNGFGTGFQTSYNF